MSSGREVFPDPPLEYVAVEIRYPYAPRLRQQGVSDAILIELDDLFPILRPQPHLTMTGIVGGAVDQHVEQVTRSFNRSSTSAVSVTANALTVDTTAYQKFSPLRSIVSRCLSAVDKHASPAAIERIGLRYVNEIRVPVPIADVRDWRGWVADSLVDAAAVISDHKAINLQGIIQYEIGANRLLTLRFAAAPSGAVVSNEPLKRRRQSPGGPFFVLDIDSFWQSPSEETPNWDTEAIMSAIDQLHEPVGSAFQDIITDKLREVVLRRSDVG